jgi:FAD/FMN-containing dehydrogenase
LKIKKTFDPKNIMNHGKKVLFDNN